MKETFRCIQKQLSAQRVCLPREYEVQEWIRQSLVEPVRVLRAKPTFRYHESTSEEEKIEIREPDGQTLGFSERCTNFPSSFLKPIREIDIKATLKSSRRQYSFALARKALKRLFHLQSGQETTPRLPELLLNSQGTKGLEELVPPILDDVSISPIPEEGFSILPRLDFGPTFSINSDSALKEFGISPVFDDVSIFSSLPGRRLDFPRTSSSSTISSKEEIITPPVSNDVSISSVRPDPRKRFLFGKPDFYPKSRSTSNYSVAPFVVPSFSADFLIDPDGPISILPQINLDCCPTSCSTSDFSGDDFALVLDDVSLTSVRPDPEERSSILPERNLDFRPTSCNNSDFSGDSGYNSGMHSPESGPYLRAPRPLPSIWPTLRPTSLTNSDPNLVI